MSKKLKYDWNEKDRDVDETTELFGTQLTTF